MCLSEENRNRIEIFFTQRCGQPSPLDRHVIEASRSESRPEMPQAGNDHAHHRQSDVGPRLIEDERLETACSGNPHAGIDVVFDIVALLAWIIAFIHRLRAGRTEKWLI